MDKVFCITCHRMTEALKATVKYFSSYEDNLVIIHVDAKSNISDFSVLSSNRVIFIDDRVSVSWGAYSQIQATINLLESAMEFEFKYLFFISGDDLPCKTNDQINEFLKSINYKNMIHFQDERNNYINPDLRVKYNYPSFFFTKNKSNYIKIKMKFFNFLRLFFVSNMYKEGVSRGLVFYKGTSWFSLNYSSVSSLIEFIEGNAWYLDIFKSSCCGDEVFFHTALKYIGIDDYYHNSNEINDALRYIDWASGPDYPRTLDHSDFDKIKRTSCIFARKFSVDDKGAINFLLN